LDPLDEITSAVIVTGIAPGECVPQPPTFQDTWPVFDRCAHYAIVESKRKFNVMGLKPGKEP
jgi:hypothetical protein